MGWKSTIEITREEAKRLIAKKTLDLDAYGNGHLEDMVESLGYGEDPDLEYFGHNFIVVD